ncbi:sorting nexin mvp1 [Didymella exigua CBS 183.55]|uniref:Sorting nexin MVP1 n=1 Tax=Didymella exigua CBS 183.55 TaxID=1150837 RepID=A0A6A5RAR3_9PLEO|nr:sorting nexin mvp1 [Didymella exigua CBS 183.55]KAF1924154.1 sorting nexin mvp1 [Didymella exigua CBS 183.55]
MSLFGDDDVPSRSQSTGLFDDDQKPAGKSGSGLFDDGFDSNDSPWAFPTPKKGGRGSLVKLLLPASDVPDSYIDAFDALLDAGDCTGKGISVDGAKKLLAGSGIPGDAQSKILEIVAQPDQDVAGLGRNEFNVLFALIGLAQEGDDVTLDSVDERKRNLPKPTVTLPKSSKPEPPAPAPAPQEQVSETPSVSQQPLSQQTPSPGRARASFRKQSFGDPEADPWGSPDLHKGHNHNSYTSVLVQTNGTTPRPTARTTSQFTTQSSTDQTTPQAAAPPPSSLPSDGGWGGYNGASSQPYNAPDLDAGGFQDAPAGGNNGPSHSSGLSGSLGRLPGGSGHEEIVTISAIAEKEGLFMFQHRNYEVGSNRRANKVVRRYSDFVWLLDCLHKRFPFRQLPLLPPKRVGINGNPIAADASFLEKRRKGLVRFTNALVRHPVLSQEQLVVMFLTVPTELSVWRKQANLSVQEEFTGKPLPPDLEDSLPKTLGELSETVRSGVRRSAETYINLCSMMERLTRRNEGMAAEFFRFSQALQSLTEISQDTYAVDTNDVPLLNEGLTSTARHLDQSKQLLEDEARGWEEGVLEDLKRQRDTLVSVRDMFDRRDKYAKDNIPALERRIASNETKLLNIRNKPADLVKPGEAQKVEDAISKDKESIVQQHARGVFIKECIRDELLYFQKSQYHVSRLHQEWSQERVKYAELQADNWRALSEQVESMPTTD